MASRSLGILLRCWALAATLWPLATAAVSSADDAPPAGDGKKYVLQYRFQPGEVLRWKVVHRATVATTIQGTSQSAKTRSTSTKAWKVIDATAEGPVTIEHSVEDIDLWQQLQGRQEVTYNSRTDREIPEGYKEAAEAVGKPLTRVKFDSRGKLIDREELHSQPNAQYEQITPLLPERPVAVGEEWSAPLSIDVTKDGQKRKVTLRRQYTLAKVEGSVAEIRCETLAIPAIDDPSIEAQLLDRLTQGVIRFDLSAGRIVGQQHDLDRRVIGFAGPTSKMQLLTRQTEELLTPTGEAASRPGGATK